jgi:hypothetical protein
MKLIHAVHICNMGVTSYLFPMSAQLMWIPVVLLFGVVSALIFLVNAEKRISRVNGVCYGVAVPVGAVLEDRIAPDEDLTAWAARIAPVTPVSAKKPLTSGTIKQSTPHHVGRKLWPAVAED